MNKITPERKYDGLEIAIIGMSCDFPESNNYRAYWNNLRNGKDLITRGSASENSNKADGYIEAFGEIKNKDSFDNSFFGYIPEEASLMDPQIRLFHEHCWKSLEDAGYASEIEKNKIGLFAGAEENINWKTHIYSIMKDVNMDPFYVNIISNENHICTLISSKLNLVGPSINIATGCSTSLVAVNLACKSLLTRECNIAIAGGVSLSSSEASGYYYQEGMIGSSDGYCRAFDKDATGTVKGEGVGVVVLKRLSDAIRDKDNIHAIIRSSAVNNDGNQKVGFTAPSVKGQSDCIKTAHKIAGIDKKSILYIETHGTGTTLGDPIEIRALNEAFGYDGTEKYCAIGSVKTNIGHLGAAAGVAGLIKAILCIKNKMIPPSLNYKEANPQIDFEKGPFYVNTQLQGFKSKSNQPLRAAVSSFGVGGTNAHVILEESPVFIKKSSARKYKLLTLSAKTEDSIVRYENSLYDFLSEPGNYDAIDIAYTLQVGRKHFQYRKSLVYEEIEDLQVKLKENSLIEGIRSCMNKPQLVFMFSGAGSQYANMGRDLYNDEMVFKNEMDKGFLFLYELTGLDYKKIFYSDFKDESLVNNMLHTQPVIFLFEYSLAKLIISLGIKPEFMIGHSIGEYVAACISEVFDFEDAMRLVVKRGQLMDTMSPGVMLSVSINEYEAKQYLNDRISIAAINGPEQIVFSGDISAIDVLIEEFDKKEVSCIKLVASHAGHSHTIDDILDLYKNELSLVNFNKPKIRFVSNLTGKFVNDAEVISVEYWLRHMRETVRFSEGIETLVSLNEELIFIEIGAGHSLTNLVKQQFINNLKINSFNLVRHPKENEDDTKFFTKRLGQLWSSGVDIAWNQYYANDEVKKVSLPTYAFSPTKYLSVVNPFENDIFRNIDSNGSTISETLKDWIYYAVWKSSVSPATDLKTQDIFLFFSNGDSFSERIKEEIFKRGNAIIEVKIGDDFSKDIKGNYVLNPLNPEHFKSLFNDLNKDKTIVTDVIYSWNLGINSEKVELVETNIEVNKAYFCLVKIVQELLITNNLKDKRFSIITDCLHKVLGNEVINYGQSLILGLVNVIPQEFSVKCRNIDLNFSENINIKGVIDEIGCSDDKNRIVALRNGQRWVKDYQKNDLPIEYKSIIKSNGFYIITGGLGNVGFELAKFLVKKYNARLILTGRRILKDNVTDEIAERFDYLKSLTSDVHYFSVDISCPTQFKNFVDQCTLIYGIPSGVIHLAGTADVNCFELIEDLTYKKSLLTFSPKVMGVNNIYNSFKNANLDFVWMTSSLASLLGGLSYCSYSASNVFMNHFISAKSDHLLNWKSIEIGEMVFYNEDIQNQVDHQRTAMKPDELVEFFEWSVSSDYNGPILESTVDLFKRIRKTLIDKDELLGTIVISDKTMLRNRPNLSNEYIAPETDTEKKLIEMIEAFFGVLKIGVLDNFFELGGDSLKAMVLIRKIKTVFLVNFSIKDFFTKQNIRQIAAEVDEIRFLTHKKKRNLSQKI